MSPSPPLPLCITFSTVARVTWRVLAVRSPMYFTSACASMASRAGWRSTLCCIHACMQGLMSALYLRDRQTEREDPAKADRATGVCKGCVCTHGAMKRRSCCTTRT